MLQRSILASNRFLRRFSSDHADRSGLQDRLAQQLAQNKHIFLAKTWPHSIKRMSKNKARYGELLAVVRHLQDEVPRDPFNRLNRLPPELIDLIVRCLIRCWCTMPTQK